MQQRAISITFILTIFYTLHDKIILRIYQGMYNIYCLALYLDAFLWKSGKREILADGQTCLQRAIKKSP